MDSSPCSADLEFGRSDDPTRPESTAQAGTETKQSKYLVSVFYWTRVAFRVPVFFSSLDCASVSAHPDISRNRTLDRLIAARIKPRRIFYLPQFLNPPFDVRACRAWHGRRMFAFELPPAKRRWHHDQFWLLSSKLGLPSKPKGRPTHPANSQRPKTPLYVKHSIHPAPRKM